MKHSIPEEKLSELAEILSQLSSEDLTKLCKQMKVCYNSCWYLFAYCIEIYLWKNCPYEVCVINCVIKVCVINFSFLISAAIQW